MCHLNHVVVNELNIQIRNTVIQQYFVKFSGFIYIFCLFIVLDGKLPEQLLNSPLNGSSIPPLWGETCSTRDVLVFELSKCNKVFRCETLLVVF